MSGTVEILIIGVIVGSAVVWALLSVWRSWRTRQVCSSCASSGECPVMEHPSQLGDLSESVREGDNGTVATPCSAGALTSATEEAAK